jgi:hypothetical protein
MPSVRSAETKEIGGGYDRSCRVGGPHHLIPADQPAGSGHEASPTRERALSWADVAEVVRLYSLRSWIEQSYKQVKNSLGWAHYQVRKDAAAIRRHYWQLW